MTRIPPAVRYSLVLFLPVLVPLLLPVPCLGSECLLLASIHLSAPSSLDPAGTAGFCGWALGPLLAAAVIFVLGLLAHKVVSGNPHPPFGKAAVWLIFSLAAFPVAWYLIILGTSVGAAETPPEEFLAITGLIALGAVVIGQPLILFWLSLVERYRMERGKHEAPAD